MRLVERGTDASVEWDMNPCVERTTLACGFGGRVDSRPGKLERWRRFLFCVHCAVLGVLAGGFAGCAARDAHSFARPDRVKVRHLSLDLSVDFERRELAGAATWRLEEPVQHRELILDTNGLEILGVSALSPDGVAREVDSTLGAPDPLLGRELRIELPAGVQSVTVSYRTTADAGALLWIPPESSSRGSPFLFTQSQPILARTWVPSQDSPGVRFTYDARVRVPSGLMAVMSAGGNPSSPRPDGVYEFRMAEPIPSYLLALAVGELEFRAISPRVGVYGSPDLVDAAAAEFADTEEMVRAAETLYGPYRWGRYDLLVLPPSFPWGGMENPRITFATPTIIAGDRSLVSLVAHELAHSWSGNLVTNASWDDFWLNEGFTVYFEHRIMEAVYGAEYDAMLQVLAWDELQADLAALPPRDTHLKLDLRGRNPEDGMTAIAYEKGYFFLRHCEQTLGRERWDRFLREHFDRHAFQSLSTEEFLADLERDVLGRDAAARRAIDVDRWVYGPGVPLEVEPPVSRELERVEAELERWSGGTVADDLQTDGWTAHHWVHFLRGLPKKIGADRLAELDARFRLDP